MFEEIYINQNTDIVDPTPGIYIVAAGVRVSFPDNIGLNQSLNPDGSFRIEVLANGD